MIQKFKYPLIAFWIVVLGTMVYVMFFKWTTYSNSEYGFRITFPKSFSTETDASVPDRFLFLVRDANQTPYFGMAVMKIPADYKEPTGPFPKVEVSEVRGSTTTPDTMYGISGYHVVGFYEGAAGTFDYFEFKRNGKLWRIEFSGEEYTLGYKPVDKKVYEKIKQSFVLE